VAPTDADDSDGSIAERVADLLVERVLPFPWAGGFLAGCGAFVLGYLVLGGYYLADVIKTLPGSTTEKLIQLGFIHYNAHTIPIIPEAVGELPANQTIARTPFSLIAAATEPLVYYAVPVVTVLAGSFVFTYWYGPEERRVSLAVLTGVSMTIGYLLLALLGTFVFVQTQETDPVNASAILVALRPGRLQTLVYGLLYPLVVGFVGSLPAQVALTDGTESTEPEERAENGAETADDES